MFIVSTQTAWLWRHQQAQRPIICRQAVQLSTQALMRFVCRQCFRILWQAVRLWCQATAEFVCEYTKTTAPSLWLVVTVKQVWRLIVSRYSKSINFIRLLRYCTQSAMIFIKRVAPNYIGVFIAKNSLLKQAKKTTNYFTSNKFKPTIHKKVKWWIKTVF